MGKIGSGYGSEWHLLRYLGYHRKKLQQQIITQTGGEKISWLDFNFSKKNKPRERDQEIHGIDFLDNKIRKQWRTYWPQRGNIHNWGAVGKLFYEDKQEWLLVEAKSHVDEIFSYCGAKSTYSNEKIKDALILTKKAFNAEQVTVEKWLAPYYQYCNRLSMLHFLNERSKPKVLSNLIFLYFYGDEFRNRQCPKIADEWKPFIKKMYWHIGINEKKGLMNRVYSVYLPVTLINHNS
jgi:hypothetical protein